MDSTELASDIPFQLESFVLKVSVLHRLMLYVRQCVYRFELRRFLLHFVTILVDGSFDLRRCHPQCYVFINHFKLNTWDGTLQTAKMTHYLKSIVVLRFD